MNKRKILGVTLILTAVLLFAITGVVAANSLNHGRGPINWQSEDGVEDGFIWGPMHGSGWIENRGNDFGPMHTTMVEAIADVSDLTEEEIDTRINNGEHLFTIASEVGISQEDYFQLMYDVMGSYFDGLADEDQFTEDDYRWMFDHMDEYRGEPFYGGCHDDYQPGFGSGYRFDGRRK